MLPSSLSRLVLTLTFISASGWVAVASTAPQQVAEEAPPAHLKIVTWNVLVGFQNKSQLEPAAGWLASRDMDIVALQEMNGFTAASLAEASKAWGHSYTAMAKETGYPVALTSRYPIEVITRGLEGMHHGYLHARTAGLDVVVVHLNPGNWKFRRREAEQLAPLVERLVAEGRDVVMLGDFNTHHPLDCAHLGGQQPLIDRRAPGKNLIRKRTFDYGPLARICGAGLMDPVERLLGPSVASIGTFPTRLLKHATTEESQRGFLERIDFILVSRSLLGRCEKASLPRDEVLEQVSDHYPVTLQLGGD